MYQKQAWPWAIATNAAAWGPILSWGPALIPTVTGWLLLAAGQLLTTSAKKFFVAHQRGGHYSEQILRGTHG